ncbi:MAG: DUF5961 family protein [Caulobacteraceae bacterium]
MTDVAPGSRRFSVHASHLAGHARVVAEPSFEAAAVAYVEDFPHTGDSETRISVIVRDLDSGRQHCFLIDLDTGETAPCG